MKTLPTMDMTGWSIVDFEVAFAGLNQMLDAGCGLLNQPRAAVEGTHMYRPGAMFIAKVTEDWLTAQVDAIFDHLKTIRFQDPKDDDRRVQLLLHFGVANISMTVPELVQLALDQSARAT